MVIRAIGRSDLKIEIITTGRWVLSALIADQFSSGRVFLAGDAAHTLPPVRGGYGANTGIEDSFNLAWKLTAVLSGSSMPKLLDTYDAERRPIAWLRHNQIFARPDYAAVATDDEKRVPIIEDAAMELGQLYRSTAVLGAGVDLPPAMRPDQWAGQPGTRAPHLWVSESGTSFSTLDLLQRDWVLLTEDERWCAAAAATGERLKLKLRSSRIGDDLMPPPESASDLDTFRKEFRRAFGIGPAGASLIRPDGYVAWRSTELPADPAATLADALAHVASV
jgi:putative polyketide hydroxylase